MTAFVLSYALVFSNHECMRCKFVLFVVKK